jgi:hypothetical protein
VKKTANGIISAYKIGKNRFLRIWRSVIFVDFSGVSIKWGENNNENQPTI